MRACAASRLIPTWIWSPGTTAPGVRPTAASEDGRDTASVRGGDLDVVFGLDPGEQVVERSVVLERARGVDVERRRGNAEEDEVG